MTADLFDGGSQVLGAGSTWTLYLADMATGGGTAQLSNWGLNFDITAVPEPATWALLIFGALAGGTVVSRRVRRVAA
ncbi:MAG: PEP-CTERM sorting domain-containing protein [Verrucomicrobia bacterium]|nr:PEP-CTERM sorting domain-containing protein [Verrucomicrobiota bacterium]